MFNFLIDLLNDYEYEGFYWNCKVDIYYLRSKLSRKKKIKIKNKN